MREADALSSVYDYLTSQLVGPVNFDDLLRFKLAYSVSAFDKLLHDIIREGMVETYTGRRPATPKYLNEPVSLANMRALAAAVTPPPEIVFEGIVRMKLKILSFQEPDKVSDGLSYVWDHSNKWDRISALLGAPTHDVRTRLKLIAGRRNSIVHEADLDPLTHTKLPITKAEVDSTHIFLLNVGNAICSLV